VADSVTEPARLALFRLKLRWFYIGFL
jgi:hypothetical protein